MRQELNAACSVYATISFLYTLVYRGYIISVSTWKIPQICLFPITPRTLPQTVGSKIIFFVVRSVFNWLDHQLTNFLIYSCEVACGTVLTLPGVIKTISLFLLFLFDDYWWDHMASLVAGQHSLGLGESEVIWIEITFLYTYIFTSSDKMICINILHGAIQY